jgi:hypothetical protein
MEILEKILKNRIDRKRLISEFQETIWSNQNANEILSDLAYELDFYEPNEKLRKENLSYYDDNRLEEEIKLAIQKLKEPPFNNES